MMGKCEQCGKISRTETKTKRIKNRIDKVYIECDHCKHEHLVCYMNREIRQKHKELRKLIERNKLTNGFNEHIETLNKEITSDMERLAEKIG